MICKRLKKYVLFETADPSIIWQPYPNGCRVQAYPVIAQQRQDCLPIQMWRASSLGIWEILRVNEWPRLPLQRWGIDFSVTALLATITEFKPHRFFFVQAWGIMAFLAREPLFFSQLAHLGTGMTLGLALFRSRFRFHFEVKITAFPLRFTLKRGNFWSNRRSFKVLLGVQGSTIFPSHHY